MNTQLNTPIAQSIFNSNTWRILFATCLSALCLIALSTQAATSTVTNTNDSGAGSLRQAIADAHDGDTIDFGVTGTNSDDRRTAGGQEYHDQRPGFGSPDS